MNVPWLMWLVAGLLTTQTRVLFQPICGGQRSSWTTTPPSSCVFPY